MIKSIFRLIYILLGLVLILVVFIGMLIVRLAEPALFHTNVPDPAEVRGTVVKKEQSNQQGWSIRSIETDLPEGTEGELVAYGYQLISETDMLLGEEVLKDRALVGNDLSCQNCHLGSGTREFAAPYVGVVNRFPAFRGREGRIATLEDRINGCMERSMNGKPLPEDSHEMKAMVAYMRWLSENVPQNTADKYKGFMSIKLPERKVDFVKGEQLYIEKCQICHGQEGQGQLSADGKSYTYPPLWGKESYNFGAGMNRVITAASFIKANMPLGITYTSTLLTDEEAYDIAGYINSQFRPEKGGVDKDYPDLSRKPIDAPYGPYGDNFPVEQHRFGPFQPIKAYYDSLKAVKKGKSNP